MQQYLSFCSEGHFPGGKALTLTIAGTYILLSSQLACDLALFPSPSTLQLPHLHLVAPSSQFPNSHQLLPSVLASLSISSLLSQPLHNMLLPRPIICQVIMLSCPDGQGVMSKDIWSCPPVISILFTMGQILEYMGFFHVSMETYVLLPVKPI